MAKQVKKPIITINGKTYPLIFGFKFLNEIKALPKNKKEDDELMLLVGGLMDGDPFSLKKLLSASLNTYDELTQEDISHYLETSDEVESLFENFQQFLVSAPLTSKKTKQVKQVIKEVMDLQKLQKKTAIQKMTESVLVTKKS
ncbi:hypothetical protein IGI37_003135 [Enterococcus sp. AZ194]|uniref:tail assembly chaperone n=1 Tax=Enterococcus sp. AZ194 TaxID=2774629 RepID=UPI003F24D97C